MNQSERARDKSLDQKQKDERLQQIEQRWLAITESTQDAILMMDPEGRVSYWNRAAERMFGHTRIEAIGQNLHDLIAPARFHPAYHTAFQKFQQTGQGSAMGKMLDLEAIRKDGQEISIQLSLSAVQMNDGWHALGLIRDITERKHVEKEAVQALEESELRLRTILDAAVDGILVVDLQAKAFVMGNKAICAMLGYSTGELYGLGIEDIHPAVALPEVRQQFERQAKGEISLGSGLPVQRKDGSVFFADVNSAPMVIAGRPLLVGVFHDVTERKRVDDELRRKEYLLSESQRLGQIGSFLFELSGTIQWSDELYRIFGVLPDTFTPTMESLLGLIHPGDRQSMQDWNAACAAGEKPAPLDYRINRPDGTMRYVRGWGEVVLDDENRPIYLAGIGQDVTEQKRAEEEIRQYVSELAEKNKELQDALADIRKLTGMLPICASCKKIKDDKGYWQGVESYISEHSEAVFSHGLCPECEGKMYEDLEKLKNEKT